MRRRREFLSQGTLEYTEAFAIYVVNNFTVILESKLILYNWTNLSRLYLNGHWFAHEHCD